MFRVLSLLLLCPMLLSAQVELTWGIPQQQDRKTSLNSFIGADSSYVYALRSDYSLFGSSDPIAERYKLPDLGLDYSKRITHRRSDDVALTPAAQFFVDGKILAFATYYDRERDIYLAYGEILDNTATVTKSWTEVARIPADKRSNHGSFYFGLSQDSLHILIVANPPYEQYADEKFKLTLLNNDLGVIFTNEISPPYKDKYFSLENFIVSADSNVYMLATISKDKSTLSRKERRTKPTYYHTALVFDSHTQELTEYAINLDPKFISNIIMTVTEDGDIICSGFYSNVSSNAIIGTFYTRIDKASRKAEVQSTMDFTTDFLEQFMSARHASKNQELYDYNLRYLVQQEDGGAVLIAEQFYEYEICATDPKNGTQQCTYYYYYNDIIVVNVSPEGKIEWARKIPKLQVSHNDGGYFLSFAFAISDNTMYFMFNENPRNLNVPKGGKYKYMSNLKRSVAVMVTMDMQGNQDKQVMFRAQDLKTYMRPRLHLQANEKKLYLYGQRKNTYKLAEVKFG